MTELLLRRLACRAAVAIVTFVTAPIAARFAFERARPFGRFAVGLLVLLGTLDAAC